MPKITIDHEVCIGCGACSAVCPATFEMRDDGKAHVKKADVKKLTCEKEAAEGCPVQCIHIK